MKNISDITSLFNYIISNFNSIRISSLLNQMLIDNILNKELYLNIVKALILIFHLNPDYFDIYYNLLYHISFKMNKTKVDDIFNKLKTLNLSEQIHLNDNMIENIIIYTNDYIVKNFIVNNIINNIIDNKIIEWVNIIMHISNSKLSVYLKSYIYICIIKQKNTILISDINTIIQNMTHFIN